MAFCFFLCDNNTSRSTHFSLIGWTSKHMLNCWNLLGNFIHRPPLKNGSQWSYMMWVTWSISLLIGRLIVRVDKMCYLLIVLWCNFFWTFIFWETYKFYCQKVISSTCRPQFSGTLLQSILFTLWNRKRKVISLILFQFNFDLKQTMNHAFLIDHVNTFFII